MALIVNFMMIFCIISPILFNLYSEYMMKDLQDDVKGITIGGKNYTNLWYANDAVFVSDKEDELQPIITRLGKICKKIWNGSVCKEDEDNGFQ